MINFHELDNEAINSKQENQSSSGIIISTGLGSTGWLKSVLRGAASIAGKFTQQNIVVENDGRFSWDEERLCYSVREPFPSATTGTSIVFGEITNEKPMTLVSKMAGNGVIFSDGIEPDYLEFNSGMSGVMVIEHLDPLRGQRN